MTTRRIRLPEQPPPPQQPQQQPAEYPSDRKIGVKQLDQVQMNEVKIPNSSRFGELPASQEAVRSRVMGVVHLIEREADEFTGKYGKQYGEPKKWPEYMASVCSQNGLNVDDIGDLHELDRIVRSIVPKSDASKQRCAEIRHVVERGITYDHLTLELLPELMDTYDKHLCKACLSFEREAKEPGLKPVVEYENNIIAWKAQVEKERKAVERATVQIEEHGATPMQYIAEYGAVLRCMVAACEAIKRVCTVVKDWTMADLSYPRRLQEEMNRCAGRRDELKEMLKQAENERDAMQMALKRREFSIIKTRENLQKAREKHQMTEKHRQNVAAKSAKNAAKLQHNRDQLGLVKAKMNPKNSIKVHDFLTEVSIGFREKIRRQEENAETLNSQLRTTRTTLQDEKREIEEQSALLKKKTTKYDQLRLDIEKREMEIVRMRDEIPRLNDQAVSLKRIYDIKVSPETIKRVYLFGYTPGIVTEKTNQDDLNTVMKIASENIGVDWVWLYHKLPFSPPRDHQQRTRDLEEIEMQSARSSTAEEGLKLMAMKSMQVWRRASATASHTDIINALKKLKRIDVIRLVQNKLYLMSDRPSRRQNDNTKKKS